MIFDHRTYTIKPNRLATFLETYERLALPLQRKYLGEPYGFFVTHVGPLGRAVHLWQYENLADRERRRDAMEADPEWQAYRRVGLEEDTLVDMENQILKPVPFFVPRCASSAGTRSPRVGGAIEGVRSCNRTTPRPRNRSKFPGRTIRSRSSAIPTGS